MGKFGKFGDEIRMTVQVHRARDGSLVRTETATTKRTEQVIDIKLRESAVGQRLEVLQALGYSLPSRLPDLGALAVAVGNAPRMPLEDIARYVTICHSSPTDG